jgi:hypothetical protein
MLKEIDRLNKLLSCKGNAQWIVLQIIDATKICGIATHI